MTAANVEVDVVAVLETTTLAWHLATRIGEGPLLTAECLSEIDPVMLVEYPFDEMAADGEMCTTCAVPAIRFAS